jgi:hypothetical protein
VLAAAHPQNISPKPGIETSFSEHRYAVDLLLPIADLGQRDLFLVTGWASWWVFGLALAGWLIAAVVVAGLTGIFKRD